jgi:hypothetical protein
MARAARDVAKPFASRDIVRRVFEEARTPDTNLAEVGRNGR